VKPLSKFIFFLVFFGMGLGLSFQNCSGVKVSPPLKVDEASTLSLQGQGELCLDSSLPINYQGYTIKSFLITNLNVVNIGGGLYSDSDSDGLSDIIEKSNVGYDPQSRRSKNSNVLDSICYGLSGSDSCNNLITTSGTNRTNKLGLTSYDLQTIGLIGAEQTPYSYDNDMDGIPDLIEMLKGTNAGNPDELLDNDNDGIINRDELAQGSNPNTADTNMLDSLKIKYFIAKDSTQNSNCSGENWRFTIYQIPVIGTLPFIDNNKNTDQNRVDLSHGAYENIILMSLILKPNSNPALPDLYLFKSFKVDRKGGIPAQLNLTDFWSAP
jgi:hypothetical protein